MHPMNGPLRRLTILLFAALAAALTGCAASQLGNLWRDETFQGTGMKNVLVIALRPDAVTRRLWEDHFSSELGAYGTKATVSYRLWADAPPDTQQVIEAVRRDGYDGVLVALRLPDEVERRLVPGYTRREMVTRQSPFTGQYYSVWRDVREPDRIERTEIAHFQTDVWTTTDGGRLVWSAGTATTDAVDAKTIREQVQMILPELAKTGILPPRSGK